ncbi:MAG: hypothetical protein P8X73_13955, partial [Ignavibacteriaceae bacterium]
PVCQVSPPFGDIIVITSEGEVGIFSESLTLAFDRGDCWGKPFMKNTVINIVTNRYNLFIRIDSSQQLEVDIPQNSFE